MRKLLGALTLAAFLCVTGTTYAQDSDTKEQDDTKKQDDTTKQKKKSSKKKGEKHEKVPPAEPKSKPKPSGDGHGAR